ncbi:MAG: PilZ domain-containing protein [Candidatus Edwardsbacteria bacterium]
MSDKTKVVQERRRFLRLPQRTKVEFKKLAFPLDTKGLISSRTKNLSGGGLLFETRERLKSKTILQMKIYLSERKTIPSVVEVVRSKKIKKGEYETAIKFLNLFEDDAERLVDFVERKARQYMERSDESFKKTQNV